ncbi:SDR family oxidoreductase [Thermogemmatispora sp.]|uniref:SDR family oxidoreductase n=1 Tax=Thermogemmatispora sp. TaxID=1968838 RepID=UPI0035E44CCC
MMRKWGLTRVEADRQPEIGDIHILKRTANPEEMASVITFLASDGAGFITAENVMVEGGYTAYLACCHWWKSRRIHRPPRCAHPLVPSRSAPHGAGNGSFRLEDRLYSEEKDEGSASHESHGSTASHCPGAAGQRKAAR